MTLRACGQSRPAPRGPLESGKEHYQETNMSEGPSKISGPIPPDPTLFPDFYRRPMSARGRLEGNSVKLDFLSGPLAPDPTLYPSCYSARPSQPAPRVHSNAREILERGQRGSVGVLLQLEGVSLHRSLSPKKKETRDHEKENVRRMREIQKKCREKDQERELSGPKPVKALWKSQKYESIPSKVMAQLQESSPVKHSESQQYLKAHSRCGAGVCPKRSSSPSPPKPEHCAGAAEDASTEIQVKGVNVDFVRHNAQNARRMPVRRSKSLQSLADVLDRKTKEQQEYISKNKGQLPQYLIERRNQWRKEAEERRKNIPDPSMPPGHTRMPENERLETLNSLQQTQKQLTKQLLMFPVLVDTIGMRNRRTDLERKLAEIEEAIKIFSRPKVFIKTND
ncbi:enkurin domain-containing protein 1 isoform X2 [Carcharodon carcharias]|uniref:enkurin domain-containing protein 1 isoform X2 n=1 Tax=Carcharodon carcharias TaxID=13397 RepID=UPI001B7EEEA8|nr:enkurin domain-containing protein 1 isoform X2 [Carcharodon carcharias]